MPYYVPEGDEEEEEEEEEETPGGGRIDPEIWILAEKLARKHHGSAAFSVIESWDCICFSVSESLLSAGFFNRGEKWLRMSCSHRSRRRGVWQTRTQRGLLQSAPDLHFMRHLRRENG